MVRSGLILFLAIQGLFVGPAHASDKLDIAELLSSCGGPLAFQNPEYVDAVMNYFTAGVYLNAQLIAKQDESAVEPEILEQAKARLDRRSMFDMQLNLDEVISIQEPSKKKVLVHRGTNNHSPFPANKVMYQVGERVKFPQFLSTTATRSLAESYAKGVIFEIEVPAGIKTLDIHAYLHTTNKAGTELLYARNAEVDITSVVEENGQTIISAKMLLPKQ